VVVGMIAVLPRGIDAVNDGGGPVCSASRA
jgi:hypothetical protein